MLQMFIWAWVLASGVSAAVIRHSPQVKRVVVFGDSYSDVHDPVISMSSAWPTYLSSFSGIRNVYNYARRGSTCADVQRTQVAQYLEHGPWTSPEDTLHVIFAGMEDIRRLVSDASKQYPWRARLDVSCPAEIINNLVLTVGARNIIWVNLIPFETMPMSLANSFTKKIAHQIEQLITAGNAIIADLVQDIATTNPEVRIGMLDLHKLFTEMYLNHTVLSSGTRSSKEGGFKDVDPSMWHDVFHPSERTNRAIGRAMSDGFSGEDTQWMTWMQGNDRRPDGLGLLGIAVGISGVVVVLLMIVGL